MAVFNKGWNYHWPTNMTSENVGKWSSDFHGFSIHNMTNFQSPQLAQEQMPGNDAEPFLLEPPTNFHRSLSTALMQRNNLANHDSSQKIVFLNNSPTPSIWFLWAAHQKQQELKTGRLEQHRQRDFSHAFAPQSHRRQTTKLQLQRFRKITSLHLNPTWIQQS